jgi:hypothetical protein
MNRRLSVISLLILLTLLLVGAEGARAQTVAAGPYYATPSWDQKLACSSASNCPRFIVLSNWNSAAVLDRETGLVWEKAPSLSTFIWLYAQEPCNGSSVGNRKGWRLPTLQELASLVDGDPANTSIPRLPPGHPFQNVQPLSYWSATTNAITNAYAWAVDLDDGFVTSFDKSNTFFVWCVRGGQGVPAQ